MHDEESPTTNLVEEDTDSGPEYDSTLTEPARRRGPSRRALWISGVLCIVLALCAAGVVGSHLYLVARDERQQAEETAAIDRQAHVGSWDDAKKVLDDQAAALIRGDEQEWLAAVDPQQPQLVETYRHMYASLRALGVTAWSYRVPVPPATEFGTSELYVSDVRVPYCMAGWSCPTYDPLNEAPYVTEDLTMRRDGTSGRYVIAGLRAGSAIRKSSTVPEPAPWQTPLVFAQGKRVTVGAAPQLASRLPEVVAAADRAAVVDDRYAAMVGNPQQRYRIFLAGDQEWNSWYVPNPAHAIAYAVPIGAVGEDVVLHLTAIPDDQLVTVLRHEMGHVATLGGTRRAGDALFNVDQWLIEGIAEYIAYAPQLTTPRVGAIRASPAITTIALDPISAKSSDREVDELYGVGHLAAACMAASYGEARLMAFVQLVLREDNSYDTASLAAFGHPFREVDQHCVDYIHHKAG